ncbi:hypothetical protein PI23P_11697 [Polaribacter irgensii 23-P]|uniref:M23ase beta-sheet core domain-containing protein n=1 Tax=Polaribacter irgensii 23-P TaxID=313594 RepID=A4C1J2_9FLAO|nr:M23 family metallopeptidase [Polaribacter irgensii]EAR11995.1 hypothetical protein PI23P_11697 [Polaribacter irgensii 23-P]
MKQLLFTLVLYSFATFSQKKYPTEYFQSPVDIPILLAGTFGELRSNHFHAGVDIKTEGKEGLKVYAVAEGYVSRIKVQQFGYGKAIYITHPNGYTSVCGHLSAFKDEIESYIQKIQYKKESYETGNIYLKKDEFPIKKGEVIAFSGDTGGSGGPHLHFEIRDTSTEKIINPLFFGLQVADDLAPTVNALQAYPLANDARIYQQNNTTKIPLKKIGKGQYTTGRIFAYGLIGFGISAYDQLNGATNKNGIYSLEMLVNGKRHYYHDVETFSFSESKFLNLLIDYAHYKKYSSKIQKLFKEEKNRLSIYQSLVDNGKIDIQEGLSYAIEIIVKDFKGNQSSIQIAVIGQSNNTLLKKEKDTTNFKIIAENFQKFKEKNVTVAFPKNTFYKDTFLDFLVEDGVAKVHEPTIPLDKSYTLTFDVSKYSALEKEQLYIANLEYQKYPRYVYTRKKDSTFYTTTKTLGTYTLKKDSLSPEIKMLFINDKQWVSKSKTLKVKISDADSGINSWRATIDGKWILMQYNHKKRVLTYNFNDKKLFGSKHLFKIIVSDNVGNTSEHALTFFRKI